MVENAVSNALASILRSGRADFNARFAAARRIHSDLDPGAFADFLRTAVDELARAVEKVRPDRLGEVTMAAYEAALELIGQKLAGPGARLASIEEGWRRILPKAASLVAAAPGRLIPAVCNAVHQIASTHGARPAQWIATMEKLGPECGDAEALLKLGQVVAWRAGLAHLRSGAIATADALPEPLALAAVGAKTGTSWASVREQLLANSWFDPASGSSVARVVAQAGAFKGFGGLFIEPPIVASSSEHFLVQSDRECWLLTADIFGATFHRASVKEFAAKVPPGLLLKGSRVAFNGQSFELPTIGELTSAAANETTLALTSPLTHSITLVALK